MNLLWVAFGGAVGACLRYIISELALKWFGKGFPWGTLIVNLLGSLIIGIVFALLHTSWVEHLPGSKLIRPMIAVGFLGALTTFSTFSMDNLLLLQQGAWLKAAINMVINVSLCLLAAWLGTQLIGTRLH